MNTRTFLHQVSSLLLVTGFLCGSMSTHAATVSTEAVKGSLKATPTSKSCSVGEPVKLTATTTGVKSPTFKWSFVAPSTSANATLTGATSAKATVTFSRAGTYRLKVEATQKAGSRVTWRDSKEVRIVVSKVAPLIITTPDSELVTFVGFPVGLEAYASDAKASITWAWVSGPAQPTYSTDFYPYDLAAYFPVAGEYLLRATATRGAQTDSVDVRVKVAASLQEMMDTVKLHAVQPEYQIEGGALVIKWKLVNTHPRQAASFTVAAQVKQQNSTLLSETKLLGPLAPGESLLLDTTLFNGTPAPTAVTKAEALSYTLVP